ncbi:MAG: thiol reductant ABC exporter subunit CydC [Anaerolineae bacterium]
MMTPYREVPLESLSKRNGDVIPAALRTFWRLVRLIGPYAPRMALALLASFATIASSIGLMATAAHIIASAAYHPPLAALQVAIVGVRFFGIARGVLRYLERYLSHHVTLRLLAHLRVWFYRALEPLAPARLLDYRSGDLLSRIISDIETLEHFYLRVLAPPGVALLCAVLIGGFIARYDMPAAVVVLVFLLVTGALLPIATRLLSRSPERQLVDARALLAAALVDTIQGLAELLAFNRALEQHARLMQLNDHLIQIQSRVVRLAALNEALGGLLANLAAAALLVITIPLVRDSRLDGVSLAVLLLATLASFEAVAPLPAAFQQLENNLAAARRLFEVIDAPPAVRDIAATSPQPVDYGLEVEALRFRYAPDAPFTLDGITFHVPDGGRVAIVGASGSGKTTLVNLLLRFWEYSEGNIRLGGHDLRVYRAEDVRRLIGVVTQHTYLFNGTLRENLLLARPGASEGELWHILEVAQLADFVRHLPEGLDTWIGEQGVRLSGGERQRLAIARVLLRDTPILILDEPTANLDALTERGLWHALEALMHGRTCIVITHRLVALEAVDEVLVLQAGRIVERGRHSELLEYDTLYRRMYRLQTELLA